MSQAVSSSQRLLRICAPQTEWEARLLCEHMVGLLNLAASEGRMERVHELLDAGVPLLVAHDPSFQEGWTLLHHVLTGEVLYPDGRNNEILVDLLAREEVRAVLNQRSHQGQSALYLAVKDKMDGAAAYLIAQGAVIDHSIPTPDEVHCTVPDPKPEWKLVIENLDKMPQTLVALCRAQTHDAASCGIMLEKLRSSLARSLPNPDTAQTVGEAVCAMVERIAGMPASAKEQDAIFKGAAALTEWFLAQPNGSDPAQPWQDKAAMDLFARLKVIGFDMLAPVDDPTLQARRQHRLDKITARSAALLADIRAGDLTAATPTVPVRPNKRL